MRRLISEAALFLYAAAIVGLLAAAYLYTRPESTAGAGDPVPNMMIPKNKPYLGPPIEDVIEAHGGSRDQVEPK